MTKRQTLALFTVPLVSAGILALGFDKVVRSAPLAPADVSSESSLEVAPAVEAEAPVPEDLTNVRNRPQRDRNDAGALAASTDLGRHTPRVPEPPLSSKEALRRASEVLGVVRKNRVFSKENFEEIFALHRRMDAVELDTAVRQLQDTLASSEVDSSALD